MSIYQFSLRFFKFRTLGAIDSQTPPLQKAKVYIAMDTDPKAIEGLKKIMEETSNFEKLLTGTIETKKGSSKPESMNVTFNCVCPKKYAETNRNLAISHRGV